MTFPNVAGALWGLSKPRQLGIISKSNEDFEVVETFEKIRYTDVVLQPIPERKLLVKPEGQRRWKWFMAYTKDKYELGWVLVDKGSAQYRVMSEADWSEAGFYKYQLTEGPNGTDS